jgi:arsenate reductase
MKHYLFVCVENACRSQMAEGFLNSLAGTKASAKSAGNMPAKTVNPLAVQVMKEAGVDISGCKPKIITADMIQEADKVVLMGCGRNSCPIIPKEVEDWRIEDPAGKGVDKFREVRDVIRKKVEALIAEADEAK